LIETGGGAQIRFASDELLADKDFVLAAATKDNGVLGYHSDTLGADKEFVLAALTTVGYRFLLHTAEALKTDKDVMLAVLSTASSSYDSNVIFQDDVPDELKADRDFMLAAVRLHGGVLSTRRWGSGRMKRWCLLP